MNLFKSKKSSNKVIIKTPDINISEIYEAFDTASDKHLKEIQDTISKHTNNQLNPIPYKELAIKLGFYNANNICEYNKLKNGIADECRTINDLEHIAKDLCYFKQTYPQYKIINKSDINKICQKYNLTFGSTGTYNGDISPMILNTIAYFDKSTIHETDLLFNYYANNQKELIDSFTICAPTDYMSFNPIVNPNTPNIIIALYPLRDYYYVIVHADY